MGIFVGEYVPTVEVSGTVRRQAWRVPATGLTPFQIIQSVQEQLTKAGFRRALDCDGARCGGFDFRFAIDVLPAPDMYINLRSFHFTSLVRGPETAPEAAITLLASRVQDAIYLQLVEVTPGKDFAADAATVTPVAPPVSAPTTVEIRSADKVGDLIAKGSIVLDGVVFDTGATTLADGTIAKLQSLAAFLLANPTLRVALVGHTDSVGSLDGNIRISKQRAEAVRQRLITVHNVPPAQVDAEGMGYLAPRASNLTEEGRNANRRVEVIVLGAE